MTVVKIKAYITSVVLLLWIFKEMQEIGHDCNLYTVCDMFIVQFLNLLSYILVKLGATPLKLHSLTVE